VTSIVAVGAAGGGGGGALATGVLLGQPASKTTEKITRKSDR
jgi:hypothetical protein